MVVESALPAAQLTVIVPPTIGEPTAAVPLRVLAAGLLLPLPLPHPVMASTPAMSSKHMAAKKLFDRLFIMPPF
ncbi:MAG: hypothetical protein AABY54_04635 [Deltaproteobacteria bacterium]